MNWQCKTNELAQRPRDQRSEIRYPIFNVCHSVRPDFVPWAAKWQAIYSAPALTVQAFSFGGNMRPACAIDTTPGVASGCGRLECQFEAALVFGDVPNTAREDACASHCRKAEILKR